jgi:hypothetical protein
VHADAPLREQQNPGQTSENIDGVSLQRKQVHVNDIGYQVMIPHARFEPGMRVDRFKHALELRPVEGTTLLAS